MNLFIAGDLYVSDRYRGKELFDPSVVTLFAGADYRIVNLEAPITIKKKQQRILKTGPHLCAAKETTLPLLKKLGVDLVTLANNHIMDFGRPGLIDTLKNLESVRIDAVGAGRDLLEATEPFILEKDGIRIAILNFGENEGANAERGKPGANPLDVIENLKQIREAKRICEFVIVIIHGGQEDFHFPTPRMVKQYRFYAENGASVIVGHHPHCISGHEIHEGSPIFYSLGNFLFTLPSNFESWYTGLILSLQVQRNKEVLWDLIPVTQSKRDYTLTLLEGEKKEITRSEVETYSRIIADQALLNQRWKTFLMDFERYYLNVFNPISLIRNDHIRSGLAKLGLDRFFINKTHYAEILNTIRCESHAEAAQSVIGHLLE